MSENDKEGFVYVLSNKSIPGLLKIGYSKNVGERIKQLSNTSVPTPFKCEYYIYSDNCKKLEGAVHQSLLFCRVNNDREFFKVALTDAIKCIHKETILLNEEYKVGSIRDLRYLLQCLQRNVDTYKKTTYTYKAELLEEKEKISSLKSHIHMLFILLANLSPENYRQALKDVGLEDLFTAHLKDYVDDGLYYV